MPSPGLSASSLKSFSQSEHFTWSVHSSFKNTFRHPSTDTLPCVTQCILGAVLFNQRPWTTDMCAAALLRCDKISKRQLTVSVLHLFPQLDCSPLTSWCHRTLCLLHFWALSSSSPVCWVWGFLVPLLLEASLSLSAYIDDLSVHLVACGRQLAPVGSSSRCVGPGDGPQTGHYPLRHLPSLYCASLHEVVSYQFL